MRTQGVLLLLRQVDQLADLGEGQHEARDRRSRKTTTVGDVPIAQAHASIFEAAQDIECARYDLYHVSIFRAGRSLRQQFLRSTSHYLSLKTVPFVSSRGCTNPNLLSHPRSRRSGGPAQRIRSLPPAASPDR